MPREFIDVVCAYISAHANKSFLQLFADLCVQRINSGRNLKVAHVRHFCLGNASIKEIKVYLMLRWCSPLEVFEHIASASCAVVMARNEHADTFTPLRCGISAPLRCDDIGIILSVASECEQTAILKRIGK